MNAPRDPWDEFAEVFADVLTAPLTPEQMDAMAEEQWHDASEFCTYCGASRHGLSCCGEVHFMTAMEFKTYHGEFPADYEAQP